MNTLQVGSRQLSIAETMQNFETKNVWLIDLLVAAHRRGQLFARPCVVQSSMHGHVSYTQSCQ